MYRPQINFMSPQRKQGICRLWLLGLALLVFAPAAFAQEKVEPKKGATVEGITEYTLPNGVRFLLFPDPSSPNVTVNMTVLVGSRHEGYGESGMAHLLEHMLFKGSPRYPNVDKELSSRGASFNGTTWLDRTNYYETLLGTDANLKFCIEFEADRLVNCFVNKIDLDTEMKVVRNEFQIKENNPHYIINQRMMSAAFQWHNYGKSTMGNLTDIERVPIDRLKTFYHKYYRPDNIVLIIAGTFDEAKALSYVSQYFGALKKPAQPVPQTYTEEPSQDGERTVMLRRAGNVAVVGSLYHTSAAVQEDNPPLEILSMVLATPPSGRLYKALVETKKASRVSANNYNLHDPSVMEFAVQVSDSSTPEEVRDILLEVSEKLAQKPITKEEVDRAIQQYMSDREQSLTNSKEIGKELSEWAGAGDWRLMFLFRDRVAKVTVDDVNRVAALYLKRTNRTVGMFIPTKNPEPERTIVPKTPDVLAAVKDYKGGKSLDLGEAFDPTPANIEARVKRLQLASGIKVAIFPKKTRGQSVIGELELRFGNEKSLNGMASASSFLGPLMRRGTNKYSRQEIKDLLDKNASSLDISSSTGHLTLSWQSKRDKLGNVLDLLEEILRQPTFPEKEFDELLNASRQSLEKKLTDPQALAVNTMQRKVNPYPATDIRYQPTIQEQIERMNKTTRADVQRLFKEQLGGQTGELVLVGDFDVDSTLKRLDAIFAGWKTTVPVERVTRKTNPTVPGSTENILTPDKKAAIYLAAMTFPMMDTAPDYPALLMGNFLLGGDFTSRLVDKLRQKDGLSYGCGSDLRADPQDPYASFVIFALCGPVDMDKVDKGAMGELTAMLNKGITKEELEAGKKAILEMRKVERGEDENLASTLRSGLYLGRTFAHQADLEKKLAALTVEEVNRAMTTHLRVSRLVIVRAGDFNKKAAPDKK